MKEVFEKRDSWDNPHPTSSISSGGLWSDKGKEMFFKNTLASEGVMTQGGGRVFTLS